MPKLKFTQKALEKLPLTDSGQRDYFDTVTPGFGLRIGKTAKTFFAQKKVNGKDARKSIGRLDLYSLDDARNITLDYLQEMRKGVNPTERERQERADVEAEKLKDVTLDEVFKDMLKTRKGKLKESTARQYDQLTRLYLSDWVDKPLRKVTEKMVLERHRTITDNAGPGSADYAFRMFRAVWNFGKRKEEYRPILGDNPVDALSNHRLWHNLPRRQRHVEYHQLRAWYEAVMSIENPTMRDYLRLLLFTGMRRNEAAGLPWENVDFEGRSLWVNDTKNKKTLRIPLNSYMYDLLKDRHDNHRENGFVFSGGGESGHLEEPKRAIEHVEQRTGIKFTSHDLRRTLLTVGAGEGIDRKILKTLVNHSVAEQEEVTSGYIIVTLEGMRRPSQNLCNRLMELCGIPTKPQDRGNVVSLAERKKLDNLKAAMV